LYLQGIYERLSPDVDEDSFRVDVLDLVKEFGVMTVRYPDNVISARLPQVSWQMTTIKVEEKRAP
jgi:alpha-L-arabinofuranosidase